MGVADCLSTRWWTKVLRRTSTAAPSAEALSVMIAIALCTTCCTSVRSVLHDQRDCAWCNYAQALFKIAFNFSIKNRVVQRSGKFTTTHEIQLHISWHYSVCLSVSLSLKPCTPFLALYLSRYIYPVCVCVHAFLLDSAVPCNRPTVLRYADKSSRPAVLQGHVYSVSAGIPPLHPLHFNERLQLR